MKHPAYTGHRYLMALVPTAIILAVSVDLAMTMIRLLSDAVGGAAVVLNVTG